MEPITLTIAMGGIVVVLIVGGISLKIIRRKNAGTNGRLKTATAAQTAADPTAIKPGDNLALVERSDSFLVTAAALYTDPEDPTDKWYEYELFDEVGRTTIYLSAELDDEDRWRWCVHDVLTKDEVLRIPELAEVSFTGKKPPNKAFSFRGVTWRPAHDSYNYAARSTDRRVDRPAPASYEARISDYVEAGGNRELSVELWDGGRCVSIGRPLTDRVLI